MFEALWQFKIQAIPVLVCLGLYELPALVRRLNRTYYIPIYFSIYPLRQINQKLAIYLAQDFMIQYGASLEEDKAEAIRRNIIFTSIISVTLDALVIPLFIGFLVAFFIQPDVFLQFVIVLAIYKAVTIFFSLKNSRYHFYPSKWKIPFLLFIYILYLGVITEMLNTSYFWAQPFVLVGDWLGLWQALSGVIFGKIIGQGILLALFVTIFSNYVADRKVREANINGPQY